jgi:hypothetical protein
MAADCQWPSGLGPDTICFYFTVDVECLAEEVLVDLRTLFDQHGVRATFFRYDVWNSRSRARASSQFPPQQRHLPASARDAWRDRSCRRGQGTPSALAFAPEAKGLRAHSLYYDPVVLPLLPLYRRLGVEYDCSYQMRLLGGLRPLRKHHETWKS